MSTPLLDRDRVLLAKEGITDISPATEFTEDDMLHAGLFLLRDFEILVLGWRDGEFREDNSSSPAESS